MEKRSGLGNHRQTHLLFDAHGLFSAYRICNGRFHQTEVAAPNMITMMQAQEIQLDLSSYQIFVRLHHYVFF